MQTAVDNVPDNDELTPNHLFKNIRIQPKYYDKEYVLLEMVKIKFLEVKL